MSPEHLQSLQSFGQRYHAEALELLRTLARIPAPSHHEERRAAFVHAWMHKMGMTNAYIDKASNVICPLVDDGTCDLVVFAAHMDVVFDDADKLPLHEEEGRLYAPGVGDDTANLVALLMAARHAAQDLSWWPKHLGMLVVANTGEEGLGNLKGTRQLFTDYGDRICRFYSFDLYLPNLVSTAVGSHRWRITLRTQGGHSWGDFGRPNAIERLCALIEDLYQLELPHDVPASINVGTIEGGTTVNAIASQANCLFEYRSTSDNVLTSLREQMEAAIERVRTPEVSIDLEEVGVRPATAGPRSEALERMTSVTRSVLAAVTGEEPSDRPSSTDANIPLSLGIPANTVGAIRGALLHTRDEWIDAASMAEGLAVVLGLMQAQSEL